MNRITPEFLKNEIADVKYQRLDGTLTHCTITTKDGFNFTGESACVDPDNFDQQMGENIAYKNAFDKMWLPYGLWLKKSLADKTMKPATENLTFAQAIELAKQGERVAREGWNGKGMWLIHVNEDEWQVEDYKYFNADSLSGFIAMKTADGKLIPWLASQADMLSEDWMVI